MPKAKKGQYYVSLEIDKELWKQAGVYAKRYGFTKSGLVTFLIRNTVRMDTMPLPAVMEEMMNEMVKSLKK